MMLLGSCVLLSDNRTRPGFCHSAKINKVSTSLGPNSTFFQKKTCCKFGPLKQNSTVLRCWKKLQLIRVLSALPYRLLPVWQNTKLFWIKATSNRPSLSVIKPQNSHARMLQTITYLLQPWPNRTLFWRLKRTAAPPMLSAVFHLLVKFPVNRV